jgi:DNA gyrase subunit B
MLANNEIKSLIIALGTNIGEQFNIDDLRYGKVIIMTDADVDGAHIRTLLLTLFYRYFPQLIENSHVYVAKPPLYRLAKGKEVKYAYSDDERDAIVAEFTKDASNKKAAKKIEVVEIEQPENAEASEITEEEAAKGPRIVIQRYKGLGEMNPDQLWQTTMDPANRVLKKVLVGDAAKADEVFDILMGDAVENRKRFIESHAKTVKNLDI